MLTLCHLLATISTATPAIKSLAHHFDSNLLTLCSHSANILLPICLHLRAADHFFFMLQHKKATGPRFVHAIILLTQTEKACSLRPAVFLTLLFSRSCQTASRARKLSQFF